MIWLWVAAAVLSAGAAALIFARAARAARGGGEASPSMAVYRRQMAEIDELAERGLLAPDDRRGVRAEAGRRLLAAADRDETAKAASRPAVILVAASATALAALGVYIFVGAPGFPDQPFSRRLQAWGRDDPRSLTPPQMAAILREIAAKRPHDPEPLHQLAVAEFAAGQPDEAVFALRKAVGIAPGDPRLWEVMGELIVIRANGEVGIEAKDAFQRALALDPKSATARYYLARGRIADGDVAGGLAAWRALAADLAPSDPRQVELAGDIDQVSKTGRLAPAQTEGAAPDQRAIQGMVDGLAARLKDHPDDPQGWVRLVRAYTVLGETAKRDAALAEARRRYAGKADIQRQLQGALRPPS
ncbi:MAG: c-type cytochrome biogenesis protein CcmI [Caulobacterales bacterium]